MAEREAATQATALKLAEPGLWIELATDDPNRFAGRPALFVDRDGTLNVDTGYPRSADEIVLIEEMVPVLRAANSAGMAVVEFTNQSGIARGLFGWPEFAATNGRLRELLAENGAHVDLVIACAYHEDGAEPYRAADHPMRKPNPGMVERAGSLLSLDLARSIVVGDRMRDLEAGRRAGLRRGWLFGDAVLPARQEEFDVRRLREPADFAELYREIAETADARHRPGLRSRGLHGGRPEHQCHPDHPRRSGKHRRLPCEPLLLRRDRRRRQR